jgi:SSS family solute:Na+ symporter
MGQALTIAIVSWTTCFVTTLVVSLATKPKPEDSLRGLVYSLTERPKDQASNWYTSPMFLGLVVLTITIILNIVFA